MKIDPRTKLLILAVTSISVLSLSVFLLHYPFCYC